MRFRYCCGAITRLRFALIYGSIAHFAPHLIPHFQNVTHHPLLRFTFCSLPLFTGYDFPYPYPSYTLCAFALALLFTLRCSIPTLLLVCLGLNINVCAFTHTMPLFTRG